MWSATFKERLSDRSLLIIQKNLEVCIVLNAAMMFRCYRSL